MKKTKKNLEPRTIRRSAQQIWLAGLGAFALAGEEGGKLFGSLVKKGQGVEKLNKSRLEKVFSRVERVGERVRDNAGRAISRIGNPFDTGMTAALHQIGVPTRKEIVTLTKRVEELTRVVARSKAKAPKAIKHAHHPAQAATA
ncbi:MAG TPA: phasin family protein [Gemmatimonadales bacterium]|nr:phasin family protein [Gemmatimonadales bacterium]